MKVCMTLCSIQKHHICAHPKIWSYSTLTTAASLRNDGIVSLDLPHLFLQVIWKCLFVLSSRDHGSLWFFKSLLNRTPVKKDPKKDVNASLDFLLTVVKGHLLAAACQILGVTKLDSPLNLPPGIKRSSSAQQYEFLKNTAAQVVEKFTPWLEAH